MSDEFYKRVRDTRKIKGLTIRQVAEATGVSRGHISEYETNKTNLESKKLMSICRFLGISFGADATDAPLYATKEKEYAPVYHMAGAGNPQLHSGDIVSTINLPDGFYRMGIIPVKVSGNSMEPVFLDGAIVGVDTNDKEYKSGKYYAVWIDDEGALIKKLSSEPGRIYVESLNRNEHSFYIDKALIHDYFILGRVVWWINKEVL